jgi:acyl dehydratase
MPDKKVPDRTPLYFDNVVGGSQFVSHEVTVTADEIVAFATQFDPEPFHLDASAAKKTFFGRLAASGWHRPTHLPADPPIG